MKNKTLRHQPATRRLGRRSAQTRKSHKRFKLRETGSPLRKLKRILVPIDFSKASRKALQYAVPFAEQFGATISLVHVIEPAPFLSNLEAVPLVPPNEEMLEDTKKRLLLVANDEIDEWIPVNVHTRFGKPSVEIVVFAKQLETDLIIISTHGYTGVKHLLLGSTAEKLVRHAHCPVLIVREPEHEFV